MAAKDSAWPDDGLALRDAIQRLCPEEYNEYSKAAKLPARRTVSHWTPDGAVFIPHHGTSAGEKKKLRAALLRVFMQKLRETCFVVGKKLQPDGAGSRSFIDREILGLREFSLGFQDSTIKRGGEAFWFNIRVFLDRDKAIKFVNDDDHSRPTKSTHELVKEACIAQSKLTPYDGSLKEFTSAVKRKFPFLADADGSIKHFIRQAWQDFKANKDSKNPKPMEFKFVEGYPKPGKRGRPPKGF